MPPCPLSVYSGLLRPLASWCLDTFGQGPPMLIGVVLDSTNVRLHPIELGEDDPLDDLTDLAAPAPWDVLVVVVATADVDTHMRGGTVAHAVDRRGQSATELDEWCGRRRTLRALGGRLHDACIELFGSAI